MGSTQTKVTRLPEGALFLGKDEDCPWGGGEPDGLPCNWNVEMESWPLKCWYLRYKCTVGDTQRIKGRIGPIAKVVIDYERDPKYLVGGVPGLRLTLKLQTANLVPKKSDGWSTLHLQFKKKGKEQSFEPSKKRK